MKSNKLDDFMLRVNKHPSGCWLWFGTRNKHGYGLYGGYWAHRFMWERSKSKIPKGLVIDHLCRVRNCVNTDHMELVTPQENTLRGFGPTARCARQTQCVKGHPFDGKRMSHGKLYRYC